MRCACREHFPHFRIFNFMLTLSYVDFSKINNTYTLTPLRIQSTDHALERRIHAHSHEAKQKQWHVFYLFSHFRTATVNIGIVNISSKIGPMWWHVKPVWKWQFDSPLPQPECIFEIPLTVFVLVSAFLSCLIWTKWK